MEFSEQLWSSKAHPALASISGEAVPSSGRAARVPGSAEPRPCAKVNVNEPLPQASRRSRLFSMRSRLLQPSAGMPILVLHFMSLKEGINFLGIIQPSGESLVQRHFPHQRYPGRRAELK